MRAQRGIFVAPFDVPDPSALAALVAEIPERRAGRPEPFDVVAEIAPGDPVEPWEAAGATWILTSFDSQPRRQEVTQAIEAGPS